MLKGRIRTLSFIIVVCFLTLVATVYVIYDQHKKMLALKTHKEVLMERLAEEVYKKNLMQSQIDSLEIELRARAELTTPY